MTKENVRIIFMGTPDFAVGTLKALVENHYNVVAVVTAPDKPAGRGRKLHESAVKQYAQTKQIKTLQPTKLKDPAFIDELTSLNADLQIVVAFRMLPEIVWDMPKMGTFNLHASLLPQYRGAAPINWAIINGESQTGVTTFFIEHKIDTGNILLQERVPIGPNDNVEKIHDELMKTGAQLVLKTVDGILNNTITPKAQHLLSSEESLKEAPKIFKADCRINWTKHGIDIHNFIRGLSPYPAAWCIFSKDNKQINAKIYKASFQEGDIAAIGEVQSNNKSHLKIACSDGWIQVEELQIAGKKRMDITSFLLGFDADDLHIEL